MLVDKFLVEDRCVDSFELQDKFCEISEVKLYIITINLNLVSHESNERFQSLDERSRTCSLQQLVHG